MSGELIFRIGQLAIFLNSHKFTSKRLKVKGLFKFEFRTKIKVNFQMIRKFSQKNVRYVLDELKTTILYE